MTATPGRNFFFYLKGMNVAAFAALNMSDEDCDLFDSSVNKASSATGEGDSCASDEIIQLLELLRPEEMATTAVRRPILSAEYVKELLRVYRMSEAKIAEEAVARKQQQQLQKTSTPRLTAEAFTPVHSHPSSRRPSNANATAPPIVTGSVIGGDRGLNATSLNRHTDPTCGVVVGATGAAGGGGGVYAGIPLGGPSAGTNGGEGGEAVTSSYYQREHNSSVDNSDRGRSVDGEAGGMGDSRMGSSLGEGGGGVGAEAFYDGDAQHPAENPFAQQGRGYQRLPSSDQHYKGTEGGDDNPTIVQGVPLVQDVAGHYHRHPATATAYDVLSHGYTTYNDAYNYSNAYLNNSDMYTGGEGGGNKAADYYGSTTNNDANNPFGSAGEAEGGYVSLAPTAIDYDDNRSAGKKFQPRRGSKAIKVTRGTITREELFRYQKLKQTVEEDVARRVDNFRNTTSDPQDEEAKERNAALKYKRTLAVAAYAGSPFLDFYRGVSTVSSPDNEQMDIMTLMSVLPLVSDEEFLFLTTNSVANALFPIRIYGDSYSNNTAIDKPLTPAEIYYAKHDTTIRLRINCLVECFVAAMGLDTLTSDSGVAAGASSNGDGGAHTSIIVFEKANATPLQLAALNDPLQFRNCIRAIHLLAAIGGQRALVKGLWDYFGPKMGGASGMLRGDYMTAVGEDDCIDAAASSDAVTFITTAHNYTNPSNGDGFGYTEEARILTMTIEHSGGILDDYCRDDDDDGQASTPTPTSPTPTPIPSAPLVTEVKVTEVKEEEEEASDNAKIEEKADEDNTTITTFVDGIAVADIQHSNDDDVCFSPATDTATSSPMAMTNATDNVLIEEVVVHNRNGVVESSSSPSSPAQADCARLQGEKEAVKDAALISAAESTSTTAPSFTLGSSDSSAAMPTTVATSLSAVESPTPQRPVNLPTAAKEEEESAAAETD